MSIPSNSPWRGCAASYPQPLGQDDELRVQSLVETIHYFNCRILDPPLADIVYRNSTGDSDVIRRVFRWDRAHYEDVFRDGFQVRRQQDTPDNVFYNLEHYVKNNGGRPLGNTEHPTNYAFVSTTLNSGWYPSVQLPPNQDRLVVEAWRYEIYAPGGILMAQTLDDQRYQITSQDEVCFVAGIAPQYVRSAQRFRLVVSSGSRGTGRERVDNVLFINSNFNPQSHPQRLINILRPISYYKDENGERVSLSINKCQLSRDKNTNTPSSVTDWYTDGVCKLEGYINAAFRSSRTNEAYIFMKNEYLLLDYAPGSSNDRVINGPILIPNGFPSLRGTAFGEYGVDCSFGSDNMNESFIFSGNLCARINYAPGTSDDYFINGPMIITKMFPFFKKTVFENGVDAAFESSTPYEAYLFKGDQYARINYNIDGNATARLIAIRSISQGFGSLRNTIFESGIDASFTSHRYNEAYLFKGDSYALINFAPGSTDDFVIGGIKKIVPDYWPSLQSILPRNNRGIDITVDDEST